MVPPVPMPETSTSMVPSVSSQISGPVVRKWISGLAGFLNCWSSRNRLGSAATICYHLLRPADGAGHAFGTGGEDEIRAQGLEHLAALHRHGLGHGEVEGVSARDGNE